MVPVSYISQTNLNSLFSYACPKFYRNFDTIRSTSGSLFAFRLLNEFSNSCLRTALERWSLPSLLLSLWENNMRVLSKICRIPEKKHGWGTHGSGGGGRGVNRLRVLERNSNKEHGCGCTMVSRYFSLYTTQK